MKQFDELTDKEKFEIVCGIKKLRESLCSLYFDTEIQPSIKYVEDMQYKTYLGEYCTEIADIFSCWLENQDLNIIYDKDSEEWCLEETKRYYAKRV